MKEISAKCKNLPSEVAIVAVVTTYMDTAPIFSLHHVAMPVSKIFRINAAGRSRKRKHCRSTVQSGLALDS